MRVLKFGGSSVKDAECIRAVCQIVSERDAHSGSVVVVVSALGGATDALLDLARTSEASGTVDDSALDQLCQRHLDTAADLAPQDETLAPIIREAFGDLAEALRGVALLGEASPRSLDRILSFGERLSSVLVAAAMVAQGLPAEACDARRLILTDASFGAAKVDEQRTQSNLTRHFKAARRLQVVTGFIAGTTDGRTTTLGRGGSDTTASIIASALAAEALEIWTDVDGVMSADPRIVPDAIPLPRMSYEELMELSHFGAKVVHPPTVRPARASGIPLWIKNTFNPSAPGTVVVAERETALSNQSPVCGIASVRPIALLRLEGDGMVGVRGIAGRLFAALARRDVNVILISQASSEHSICFAVRPDDVTPAREASEEEFRAERAAGMVDAMIAQLDLAVVAVVGAGMRERTGISGRLFGVLGTRAINVHAIAQGSSELNISLVVAAKDEVRTVNALHDAFFLSGWRTAHIGLAGVGGVGAELLAQLARRQTALRESEGIRLILAGVSNSRSCSLDSTGLEPLTVAESLLASTDHRGLDGLVQALCEDRRSRRIFVDCTASDATGERYVELLSAGISVVTANKRMLAGPLADYRMLQQAGPGRLYYETTVGAGLPIVRTLRNLLATGDSLRRLEGVLSGTLSYLLAETAAGTPLSTAIREAHRRGFTEPDPREDLGGADVARKVLILARLAALPMEPEHVQVQSFLPADPWNKLSLGEFWERLPEMDAPFQAQQKAARDKGMQLSYLAQIEDGQAKVGFVRIAEQHPCWNVGGGENLVAFRTSRYGDDPLVVRGPGAGHVVTAAGVFADILTAVAEDEGDWA